MLRSRTPEVGIDPIHPIGDSLKLMGILWARTGAIGCTVLRQIYTPSRSLLGVWQSA